MRTKFNYFVSSVTGSQSVSGSMSEKSSDEGQKDAGSVVSEKGPGGGEAGKSGDDRKKVTERWGGVGGVGLGAAGGGVGWNEHEGVQYVVCLFGVVILEGCKGLLYDALMLESGVEKGGEATHHCNILEEGIWALSFYSPACNPDDDRVLVSWCR